MGSFSPSGAPTAAIGLLRPAPAKWLVQIWVAHLRLSGAESGIGSSAASASVSAHLLVLKCPLGWPPPAQICRLPAFSLPRNVFSQSIWIFPACRRRAFPHWCEGPAGLPAGASPHPAAATFLIVCLQRALSAWRCLGGGSGSETGLPPHIRRLEIAQQHWCPPPKTRTPALWVTRLLFAWVLKQKQERHRSRDQSRKWNQQQHSINTGNNRRFCSTSSAELKGMEGIVSVGCSKKIYENLNYYSQGRQEQAFPYLIYKYSRSSISTDVLFKESPQIRKNVDIQICVFPTLPPAEPNCISALVGSQGILKPTGAKCIHPWPLQAS